MSNSESPISINEHLSALLDDEAGSFEERRVLDELKVDQKLSHKLSTYALIGETIRTGDAEKPVFSLGSDFLDSIHEKIALEDEFNEVILDNNSNNSPVTVSKESNTPTSWLRPVGGFAVAASVGALAFMGLQNMGLLSHPNAQSDNIVKTSTSTTIAKSPTIESVPASDITEDSLIIKDKDQYVDADAQTRSMLKRYVDSHMQYTTTSAFVPSVRVIAYTDNQ